jgi:tetratricopeptide (TPR) repeat protein
MFRLFVAVLLASAFGGRSAQVLAAELDAVPAGIETLYDAGQYRQAAEALQAAVAQNPTNPFLFYWLGRCYYEMRDFDRSISSWERAVALDSARSEYHDWLGRAYGLKADEDSHSKMASALSLARRTHHEFEVAVQLDDKNVKAQRDLIAFMASAPGNLGGGEVRAMAQIRTLSSMDSLEGMLALADLYAMRKKFEQASRQYQEILKFASNRTDAYFETADCYRDHADSEHLQQAIDGALTITRSDRRLNYYVGVALVLAKKDLETAEKHLRTYIDTVPENSELPPHVSAHEYLGQLYEYEGYPNLAVAQYNAALAIDPHDKAAREELKRLHNS